MRLHRFVFIVSFCLATTQAIAFQPFSGDFSKLDENHVRVMSYNTLRKFPRPASGSNSAAVDAAYDRILSTINPDIISFQEIPTNVTANEIRIRLVNATGGEWYVYTGQSDGTQKNALASRWLLTMTRQDTDPASEVRGVTQGLVNLPAGYATNFYVMAVHFKAFREEPNISRRQRHADAVAAWFGDLRTPGGVVTLPDNTPILLVGDVNFATGDDAAYATLLTGSISTANQPTYGAPIKPDWDNSDNADPMPRDPFTSSAQSFSSDTTTPSSRLDRFIYTDSTAGVANGFILNTLTMSALARSNAGLLSTDTTSAVTSDHLPLAVDFIIPRVANSSIGDWMILAD